MSNPTCSHCAQEIEGSCWLHSTTNSGHKYLLYLNTYLCISPYIYFNLNVYLSIYIDKYKKHQKEAQITTHNSALGDQAPPAMPPWPNYTQMNPSEEMPPMSLCALSQLVPSPALPSQHEGGSIHLQKALLQSGVLTHSNRGREEPRSVLKTALYSMSTFSFFSLLALFVEF